MPKIARVCPVCGKTFFDWPSDYRVTCSYRCARTHVRPDARLDATCAHCGTAFSTIASHGAKYCSRACWLARRGTLEERFWSHVPNRPDDGCWEWAGPMRGPYGQFSRGHNSPISTHRMSYELTHGPIPPGMVIRHMCHNGLCVRPDHLKVGTTLDNVRDRVEAGRSNRNGANNRKLTDAQVAEVRAMLAAGMTGIEVARHFGVSDGLISLIKTGKHRS